MGVSYGILAEWGCWFSRTFSPLLGLFESENCDPRLLVFKDFFTIAWAPIESENCDPQIAGGSNIIRSNEADEYCGSKSNRRGHRRFVPLSSTEQVPPGLFRWQGMALGSLLLPTIRNSTVSSMSFQTFGKMMGGKTA